MVLGTHVFAGSRVQVVYTLKFLTFTPDQFKTILTESGFTPSQLTPPGVSQPPGVSGLPAAPVFSRKNMIITLGSAPGQAQVHLVFIVLNTVDLTHNFDDSPARDVRTVIETILNRLDVAPEIVSLIQFACIVPLRANLKPGDRLTNATRPEVREGLSHVLASLTSQSLFVSSIRLSTTFPIENSQKSGFQMTIEPLVTGPDSQYFVQVNYQTTEFTEWTKFITNFGAPVLNGIKDVLEANA